MCFRPDCTDATDATTPFRDHSAGRTASDPATRVTHYDSVNMNTFFLHGDPVFYTVIRWEKIQTCDEAPPRERCAKIVQSWDTALADHPRANLESRFALAR